MTSDTPPCLPDGGEDEDGPDPPDDVIAALQSERRRTIVTVLLAEDGELTLVTLASKLAAAEDAALPNLLIELHDVHLPALTECDAVEFNDDTGEVSLQLPPETMTTAVELAAENRGSR